MISKLTSLWRQAAISVISGAMFPASFRTGTTTETAGGAPPVDVSLILFPSEHGPNGRALWGDQLCGNPFDTRQGGSRHRANAPIAAAGREGQPARREPVPHQDGARHPDDRAGE